MTNKRVLILDDKPAILEVLYEALRYEDYEVLDISYGYELLEATADFMPDLILLDYRLADTNGGDLCQALKSDPAYRHIPVIIFSAYFNPSDRDRPGGCDGILYKPFDLEELLDIVHCMSNRTRLNNLVSPDFSNHKILNLFLFPLVFIK